MAAPATALQDSGPLTMAANDAHSVREGGRLERRREFENILSHALPRFRRIAMRWLGNHEDAEDAVQDAMLSAFTHIADFEGRSQMSTWLIAVVINAIRMQLRRSPRGHMLSLDCSPKEDQSITFAEFLLDSGPTPEQTLEQRQFRQIIIKLTKGLPPHRRAALLLRQQDCYSLKETAKILGVPVGTVKAQLARGRAKLIERFHKVTGTPRIEASGSGPKTKRKAASSRNRRNCPQATAHVPIPAILNYQGGSDVWVGV